MKPQPEPATQEVLAGLVERVTSHNAENGFCVLRTKARGHRDLITLVGHAATIAAGDHAPVGGGRRGARFSAQLRPSGQQRPDRRTRRVGDRGTLCRFPVVARVAGVSGVMAITKCLISGRAVIRFTEPAKMVAPVCGPSR